MNTPTQQSYSSMMHRCYNPKRVNYKFYGAKGIRVTEKWAKSIDGFISDMGTRPSLKHSLDRINNDCGYFPENCRWVLVTTQVRNQKTAKSNKSGTRGVSWSKKDSRWSVRITVDGKRFYVGFFTDLTKAKNAREAAERKYWLDIPIKSQLVKIKNASKKYVFSNHWLKVAERVEKAAL